MIASRIPPALLEERALVTLCPCVLALLAFRSLLAVALRSSRSHVVLESVQEYGRSCGAKWWARNLQNGPGGGVENEASGGRKWLPGGFRGDSGWPLAGEMATRGGGSKLSSVVCALLFFFWRQKCASGGLLGRSWRLLGSFWASPPPPRRAPGGHFGRFFETSGAGPRKIMFSIIFLVFLCLFLC